MDGQRPKETKLEFQDFGNDDFDDKGQTINFSNFPDTALDDDDDPEAQLISDKSNSTGSNYSFWTFAYYQQFFDVDTQQVKDRLMWSMIPNPKKSYLQYVIRPKPDLYGPFWTCITLIFCIAIAGNMANYLQFSVSGNYVWKYDFHKVSLAASVIFTYVCLLPVCVWGFLWWRHTHDKTSAAVTFLEIICIYGYSLTVFIPVSICWVVNVPLLRWTLVIIGSVLSSMVLLISLWPTVKADVNKFKFGFLAGILAFHMLLGVGFMEYFFYVPEMLPAKGSLPIKTELPIIKEPQKQEPIDKVSITKKSIQDPPKLDVEEKVLEKTKSESNVETSKKQKSDEKDEKKRENPNKSKEIEDKNVSKEIQEKKREVSSSDIIKDKGQKSVTRKGKKSHKKSVITSKNNTTTRQKILPKNDKPSQEVLPSSLKKEE